MEIRERRGSRHGPNLHAQETHKDFHEEPSKAEHSLAETKIANRRKDGKKDRGIPKARMARRQKTL